MNCIDLGLPSGTLWEACNLGAEAFWENGKHYSQVVASILGSLIPSEEQWEELKTKCLWNWDKKKNMYEVVGPNGNRIYIPLAGYISPGESETGEGLGAYWSSTCDSKAGLRSWYNLYPDDMARESQWEDDYKVRLSIRLVRPKTILEFLSI